MYVAFHARSKLLVLYSVAGNEVDVMSNFFLLIAVYKFGNKTLYGNCSIGQLTKIGFEQELLNGKTLHDAYVSSGFLSPTLSNSEVYIRSDGTFILFFNQTIKFTQVLVSFTDVPRTLHVSLQLPLIHN